MREFAILLMKEEKALFCSPIAYAAVAAFLLIMGYSFCLTLFISHTPTPEGMPAANGGEFDDMMVWISVGTFYGRLATAGVLP